MWPFGLYGNGMHDYVMAEIELGERVAVAFDSKYSLGDDALADLMYEESRRD
jgi:hypothetical protein